MGVFVRLLSQGARMLSHSTTVFTVFKYILCGVFVRNRSSGSETTIRKTLQSYLR